MNFSKIKHTLFLFVIFMFTALLGYGQNSIYFDHITLEDGLSQGDINDIHQDKKGFMWFGTHDGLNKFDGYNFEVYKPETKNKHSINSNLIYAVTSDEYDNLWIGTTGKGLNVYNKATGEFTSYLHNKNKNSLSSNHVGSVFVDTKNRLWVGTLEGLNVTVLKAKYQSKTTLDFLYFPLKSNSAGKEVGTKVNVVFQDRNNRIWVGNDIGLFLLSKKLGENECFEYMNSKIKLPKVSINSIKQDKFGRLVLGTADGVFISDVMSEKPDIQRVSYGFTQAVCVDQENNLWTGGDRGLFFYTNTYEYQRPKLAAHYQYNQIGENNISKNVIKSLFVDKTGIVWVGTEGGGINKVDPMKKGFSIVKSNTNSTSLSYDNVKTFYEDDAENLWIGTKGGGINIALKEKGYNSFIKLDKLKKCLDIEKTSQNKLLFGAITWPGLFELDLSKVKDISNIKNEDLKPVNEIVSSVFSLHEDNEQTVWIGTYGGGIYRWRKNKDGYLKDKLEHDSSNLNSLPSNIIRKIYEDSKHNIWIGTSEGLSKISSSERLHKNPKIITYKNMVGDLNSISHNYILEILESSKGELWVGTLGGGVNKLTTELSDTKGSFINYTVKNGLANNVIKGILEDDEGDLWISTNKGISKYNVAHKLFKNYDINDGLQSNEFQELACLKRKNGELLFGGTGGFNFFFPKNIKSNPYKASAVITKFYVSNLRVERGQQLNGREVYTKPIDEIESLELKYNENSVSFEFAALHYSAPEKNRFAYRLKGFDKDWVYTDAKKRFATYTNLNAGTYVFQVKATNNSGVWEDTFRELTIEITPPIWKTTCAYLLYVVLFVFGLFWIWRRSLDKTRLKHAIELANVEKDKSEEIQNLKLEFFTNISHEFKTPLTLIKGPLDFLQKRGLDVEKDTYKEQLNLMQKNTNYLLRLVNQLLDFRRVNQGQARLTLREGDIVSFVKELCEPFQFLVQKKNITFQFQPEQTSVLAWFDKDVLEKVINNLLSNAYKFTPVNGKITLHLVEKNERIAISVLDTGTGISKTQMPKIFKRYYTKKDKNENNPKGIGIGLAYAKTLMELHQGAINVTSETGKGAEFRVEFPKAKKAYENEVKIIDEEEVKEVLQELDMIVSETEELPEQKPVKKKTKKRVPKILGNDLPVLLVVDDNEDIRKFIRLSLQEQYKIYEAENGLEGFEIAIKIIPNIIITDLVMHVMDGLELCEKLKTTVTTSHIPVLILTAKLSHETELKGLKNGADDYIKKPFEIEHLELKLKNIIEKRQLLRKRYSREVNLKPVEFSETTADERFLKQVVEIIDKNMSNTEFSVDMLVKAIGQSRSNLYLKIKDITGMSSTEFIRSVRLKRAMELFNSTDLPVKEVMYKTGFSTASYFSKCFKRQYGEKPSDYLNKKKENPNLSVDDLLKQQDENQ